LRRVYTILSEQSELSSCGCNRSVSDGLPVTPTRSLCYYLLMSINVETNETLTLLYSLLNRFDQAGGETNTHPLREQVKNHFKDYAGKEPHVDEYIHEHKVVVWALTVGNPPKFKPKDIKISSELQWHIDKGKIIKPYLIDFYNKTDFKTYYKKLKNSLGGIKKEMEQIISQADIEKMLKKAWGINVKNEMIVIPNPFTHGSFGPQIGEINYQVVDVIGKVNKRPLLHTIIHEGSHPIAKQILKLYAKDIEKKKHLLKKAQQHPKYSKAYNTWETCFEEHLIRAVHMGFINEHIFEDYEVEKGLEWEKNRGMVFIDTFFENLHEGNVSDSIPKILGALEKLRT